MEAYADCCEENDGDDAFVILLEILLHAFSGWITHKTMRVVTTIETTDVAVLIDSGSTHNFMSERIANMLQLPIAPINLFEVRVANGKSLICQGIFDNMSINI